MIYSAYLYILLAPAQYYQKPSSIGAVNEWYYLLYIYVEVGSYFMARVRDICMVTFMYILLRFLISFLLVELQLSALLNLLPALTSRLHISPNVSCSIFISFCVSWGAIITLLRLLLRAFYDLFGSGNSFCSPLAILEQRRPFMSLYDHLIT